MTAMLPAPRLVFLGLFLFTAGLMAFGYYLQYVVGLEPCPLCMTQRVFIVASGLVCLFAAALGARSGVRRAAGVLVPLLCVAGSGFAGRHLWLQSLPEEQVPACGPSVDYLLDNFPLLEALEILLRGNGNCAEVDWALLGISIPGWTLLAFIGIGVAAAWNGWRRFA
jgi:disulfide bond formation protein DsbB